MAKLITLKLEEKMLEQIDDRVETGLYSSRTDFIRDVIREKIELEKRRAEAYEYLKNYRGKGKRSKGHIPAAGEVKSLLEKAFKEHAKKMGWDDLL